jgi:uncharacterized membrane protein
MTKYHQDNSPANASKRHDQENRLAHWVHWSLLAGVLLSGLVLAVGLARDPARGPSEAAGQEVTLTAVIHGAEHEDGVSLINLGLLLLMATPILRIAVLGVGWLVSGEGRFASAALVVLLLLLLSIKLGLG